jgi:hypothetical protein
MRYAEKKSLKGIKIRQPRAERGVALGRGAFFLPCPEGARHHRENRPLSVEPFQGSMGRSFFPRATLRSALGYCMYKPFRLFVSHTFPCFNLTRMPFSGRPLNQTEDTWRSEAATKRVAPLGRFLRKAAL